ncbi:MAG TPA: sigma-54 dependent transcriptional regulator [Verrucomicrobiae bacterium]|nr:sigma-54 dependent transcriptional regulator [Verrucomicrobiae bacterium]
MKTNSKVLIIEDDRNIATGLQKAFRANGYDVSLQHRGDDGLAAAIADRVDVVITDLKMPGLDGLELVRQLHAAKPKLPILLITAHGTTETAIEATKWGAFDYVPKPFDVEELLDLTAKALESSRLMSEPIEMGDTESPRMSIVGKSRAMQMIYKEIGRIAAASATVLIRGETGTGKELIARAIYQHSDRSSAPFIAINCAAIPENLLESELFGHERGAFTGADARRIGRFEQANGGTLFLDEIGDMNANLQVKLLRVLQDQKIQRLGGKETVAIDVRIIAATHRDLEEAIAERAFREDLFYRLSVVTINLPPLHQRAEDIPDMVRYFLRRYGPEAGVGSPSITPEAIAYLQKQPWPGNVRELENTVRKALLIAREYTIGLEHVKDILEKNPMPNSPLHQTHLAYVTQLMDRVERGEVQEAFSVMLRDLEPQLYAQAIARANGNLTKAAQWLGVTRLKMREKLKEFGLHPQHGGGSGPDEPAL